MNKESTDVHISSIIHHHDDDDDTSPSATTTLHEASTMLSSYDGLSREIPEVPSIPAQELNNTSTKSLLSGGSRSVSGVRRPFISSMFDYDTQPSLSMVLSTPPRRSLRSPRRMMNVDITTYPPPPPPLRLRQRSFHRRVRPVWAKTPACGHIVSISVMDKTPIGRVEHVNSSGGILPPSPMHNMS